MPNAENAKLQYEGGQTAFPMGALTDSGDATSFTSSASLWSGRSGYEANVKPNGIATGGVVTPAAAAGVDDVDVAALTCYLAGVKTSVNAAVDQAILRPTTDSRSRITSVQITSAGAVSMVGGTEHGTLATFVETRGDPGGPPHILAGSIEVAQIRVSSNSSAVVTSGEIFSVIGVHTERYDYPVWDENNEDGTVDFASALPLSHTGDIPKAVFASYAEPVFVDVSLGSEFVPPENSYSVSSTPIYGTTLGSSSASLGQGSFIAYLNDGIVDPLVQVEGEVLWFKFFPNRYATNYILSQGKLGMSRSYPADDNVAANCTISASEAAQNVVV